MDLQRDQIVGQRYQLVDRLGEGGMGEVWSALHVITRKAVAIKFLKKHEKDVVNQNLSARFLREARAASAIHHPNVVEVHDVLTHDDGMPMMVMDLLRGRTLSALLELRPLDAAQASTILLPIVSAVGTAHALGIVHRDLKPDNLFLAQLGDGRIEPKVLDFGIAKLGGMGNDDDKSSHALTATGSMLGTPYYMSPEQMFGEKNIDGRSDVWSLGVILYECLTGNRPFDGENFGQLMKAISTSSMPPIVRLAPQTPPEMVTMVERMLKVNRNERPSIDELHHFLGTFSTSRDSARIQVPSMPPSFAGDRTSFLAPQTGPGYPPQARPPTGPAQQMPPPSMPMTMLHQTGPRTPTPVPPYGPFGAPSTLSGASTSQTGGPVPRPPASGLPAGVLAGILGGLVIVGGGIIVLAMLLRSPRPKERAQAADAQSSAAVHPVVDPVVTAPPVSAAVSAAPIESASAPAVDAGTKLVPIGIPAPPPRPGPGPAPAPAAKPTTAPGGVVTAVPF